MDFRPGPRFSKTVFRAEAHFGLSFLDGADFVGTVFEDTVTFSGARFKGWTNFASTRFERKVDFTWAKVHGKTWFKGAEDNLVFCDEAVFSRLEISPDAEMSFETVSLAKASFLHSDIEALKFIGVRWGRDRAKFRGRLATRRLLWDEARLQAPKGDADISDAVAENYRQLVLYYEARRDFESAEDFHIGEMETRRLSSGAKSPSWLRRYAPWLNAFAIYRILSAYGTSYWQALIVLIFIIAFLSATFLLSGLSAVQPSLNTSNPALIKYELSARDGHPRATLSEISQDYVRAIAHTLSLMTFQRERQYRATGTLSQVLEAVASIVMAGQTALFLLAIRRRFRR
jgi:hypothetical protein